MTEEQIKQVAAARRQNEEIYRLAEKIMRAERERHRRTEGEIESICDHRRPDGRSAVDPIPFSFDDDHLCGICGKVFQPQYGDKVPQ